MCASTDGFKMTKANRSMKTTTIAMKRTTMNTNTTSNPRPRNANSAHWEKSIMKRQSLAAMLLVIAAASPAFAKYALTTLASFGGADGSLPTAA
jgi:hypothetical protein